MSKSATIWMIIAAVLIVIGLILFAIVMTKYSWDFSKLSTTEYETNQHTLTDSFRDISIKTDTADIRFLPSENGECKIVCYEEKKVKHSVSVEDEVLTIRSVNEKRWFEHIGVNFNSPKITVYLPEKEYASLFVKESTGDVEISQDFRFENMELSTNTGRVSCYASASKLVKIVTDTGDIRIEKMTAGTMDLKVSTGKIDAKSITCEGDISIHVSTGKTALTDVTCNALISGGSTGDITLKNVIARQRFSIQRSTGDVVFDHSDAAELYVETDTGDVTGSLLTEKVFNTDTSTGKVRVPNSVTGGKCEITTDTGEIKIEIS